MNQFILPYRFTFTIMARFYRCSSSVSFHAYLSGFVRFYSDISYNVILYRNKKRFHHQALVEVKILDHLRKKDLEANASHNVIHMLEYFYFRNHLCITFELMRYEVCFVFVLVFLLIFALLFWRNMHLIAFQQ